MNLIVWRYVLAILSTFGICLVYMLRVNLSVTIIKMVNSTVFQHKNSSPECPVEFVNNSNQKSSSGTFLWSEFDQGLLLSSFYWGYAIMQIPCGFLSVRFDAKWIYAISTLMTILLTFLTPVVAYMGLYQLIVLRFFMGFFEGPTYPSLYNLCSKWVLESESSAIMSTVTSGAALGTIIGQTLAGFISEYYGWEAVYYVMGVIGVIWFICFALFTSNSPRTHRFIGEKEKQLLITNIIANHDNYKPSISKVPWFQAFTSKPVLALLSVNVTYNFTWYMMINCLPYYIGEVLGFNISSNGAISSAPYIANIGTTLIFGQLFECIAKHNFISKTKLRKSFVCSGLFLACCTQMSIIAIKCNVASAIVLICITMGLLGVSNSSTAPNYIDLAPTMSGSILSVINVCGTITGILTPYIKAVFTETGETRENWKNIFMTSSIVLLFGSVIFLIFGSASPQKWALRDLFGEEVLVDADYNDDNDDDDDDDKPLVYKHTIQ